MTCKHGWDWRKYDSCPMCADENSRAKAQETSEPVKWIECWEGSGERRGYSIREDAGLRHGDEIAYLGMADRDGVAKLVAVHNTTPQPTPNVQAAVAAAYRKAAGVLDSAYADTCMSMRDVDHIRSQILALPHDDSALREICLKVEEELAEVLEVSCKGFLFETVVDRVLGEVKCS